MRRELQAGWLAMSVLLGSTAATSSVRGEERTTPEPSAESERERAVRDFEEGRSAHVTGRLEEAELLYLRAWARMKSFDIAVNLGQVQLRLNKPASAAKHLAYGVRTVGPEIESERLARMEALLSAATAQVGAVRLQATNVADAEVFVDGERVAAEEVKHEIYVEPGEHRLVIRRAGYEEIAMPLMARAGVRETVPVAMKPLEAKASEAKAPMAGRASVVRKEKTNAPAARVRVEERRSWVPVIALGAASVVGLGVGVGTTVARNNLGDDVDAKATLVLRDGGQCVRPPDNFVETCAEISRMGRRGAAFGDAARVAYIASGTLAVAAAVYALWPRGTAPVTRHVQASAGFGSDHVVFHVRGAW